MRCRSVRGPFGTMGRLGRWFQSPVPLKPGQTPPWDINRGQGGSNDVPTSSHRPNFWHLNRATAPQASAILGTSILIVPTIVPENHPRSARTIVPSSQHQSAHLSTKTDPNTSREVTQHDREP